MMKKQEFHCWIIKTIQWLNNRHIRINYEAYATIPCDHPSFISKHQSRFVKITCLFLLFSIPLGAQTSLENARKLYEERKPAEVKKILSTINDDSKEYAAAQYYLGRIAFDEKNYDDAQEFFEEAVDANDKVAEYQNWLGNSYGQMAEEANMIKQEMLAPKMKNAWESAMALDPTYVEPRESLVQFYLQAPGFMGGSVDKAKEMARQIMKQNAARGHLQMGNIYNKEKQPAEAEREFIEMVKADPTYQARLANYYVNQKQFDKAFALYEETVKKNSNDMASIYQIGKTSALSGQKAERGEACLKKYLAYTPKPNEPSLAGANMRLAQITERKGNKSEAKRLYETALKLDASLKEAQEGLRRTSQ